MLTHPQDKICIASLFVNYSRNTTPHSNLLKEEYFEGESTRVPLMNLDLKSNTFYK
jgi:hypothetical protein